MQFKLNALGAVFGLALGAILGAAPSAATQDFPTKPITILVGYNPGDNMDVMTRHLAELVEKKLGQPINIVNKPGVAGAVSLGVLAQAAPDGYTLASVVDTPLSRMLTMRKMDYTQEDFAPVMQFSSGVTGVVVKADSPWQTFEEFIADAKANPRNITYATSGAGSTMHVAMQYVGKEAGLDWTHVPYPGARDTLAAVLGGHVNAAVGSTQWVEDVRAGNMRLLAVISDTRMPAFPDVPTLPELGYDFDAHAVSVIVAPAGTPEPIIAKLDDAFHGAMETPEFKETLTKLIAAKEYRGHTELTAYLKKVKENFAGIIADLGIPTELNK
ncbi:Bug family tripartite tricarboxylate transporter substrate binding protein [Chelativorans salis]|uniref:Tripartite tricarboxylate transporter substrate binding protein n=1 Tax=Chelativorans salis TaxID=2978478 RepID=A0ABT2LQ91_9HYPH|nr:tripartite tricarboxylate transporter substrate binding protein [Chelativorans sp. EGI FJ00035]MCT7376715.1 tripartite tricarboxylate transporter substrate binding protein [Chelativorans sp. EGI FJ00035]